MDWLKKAASWLGNAVYQGAKFLPGSGNIIRSYEQTANQYNQARQRVQQQRPQQQIPQAPPKLNYNAALRAIQNLPGASKNVANFVAPKTVQLGKQGVNQAQAVQMRLNALGKTIGGQKVDQNYWNRIKQLESQGFVPQDVLSGKANVAQFGAQIAKTGAPVGLEIAPFVGGSTAGVAKMGIRQAAPKILKEGLVYGGARGAYTLGFGEGDIKQRAKQAAIDVATGPLYEAAGYGVGRLGGAIVGRIKGKPQGKVRVDAQGRKIFAPQSNIQNAKIKDLGQLGDDVRFTGKQAKGAAADYIPGFAQNKITRLVSQRELDVYNKTGKLPANSDGYTNVIMPGGASQVRNVGDSKKFLVTFNDNLKIKDVANGQGSYRGGIPAKYIERIDPAVEKGPVLSGIRAHGNDVPDSVFKQDPLEALKAEARKKYGVDELSIISPRSGNPNTLEIDKLYINPSKQRAGNGRAVLDEIFKKNPNIDAIEAYPGGKSQPWWLKQGTSQVLPDGTHRITRESFYNQATKDASMYGDGQIGNDVPKSVSDQIKKLSKNDKAIGGALGMSPEQIASAKSGDVTGLTDQGLDSFTGMKKLKLGQSQSKLAQQVELDAGVPNTVLGELFPGYARQTNKKTFELATKKLDKGGEKAIQSVINGRFKPTAENNALQMVAFRRLIDQGREQEAAALGQRMLGNATEAGRAVQIYSAYKRTTPEGALMATNRIINEANKNLPKGKQLELGRDKALKIQELATEVQKYTIGTRERQVAEALLEKEMQSVVPPTALRKLSTIQTFAQLLNPKTAIRNLGGNAVFGGAENVSTTVATPIDALIGKFTGQRSVSLPSLSTQAKGFAKGAKFGFEDTNLGIKTSGSATQFEIRPDVFKNKVMKGLERVLGYELSVPDKAFYQAAFDDSLRGQMKAMKLSKATPQVIEQANQEALYKTFQGNSNIAKALSTVKRGLNAGQDFGLGDAVLKYPKTPGNIVAAGLDYTGVGVGKGINTLIKGIRSGELTPIQQRQAAIDIGRGLTGLGVLGGGAAAAQSGLATGNTEKDRDVQNLLKQAGNGQYSFNLSAAQRLLTGGDTKPQEGDTFVNYDWIQPMAVPFSIGANAATPGSLKNRAANVGDSINAGVNTVVEQPVLQGLKRLFSGVASGNAGGGIVDTVTETLKNIPSSFMPSLLNQIGQYTDPYSRNTYDPNPVQESANMVKGRVPGLRTQLEPRVNTFGEPQKMYEDNNFFNVFLNPAFVKHYNLTPEAQLTLDVFKETNEKGVFPRTTDKKMKVNGQERQLTSDELRRFQEYTGTKTKETYARMTQDPYFNSLSDTEKATKMGNVLSDIAAAAKIEVLGDKPKKVETRVQQLLDTGQAAYEPVQKVKKVKPPKLIKAKTRKVRVSRAPRGGRTTKTALRIPRTPARRSITSKRAKAAPKIKFAKAPSRGKTAKIRIG